MVDGPNVGAAVGAPVGKIVGLSVGECVGRKVGTADGGKDEISIRRHLPAQCWLEIDCKRVHDPEVPHDFECAFHAQALPPTRSQPLTQSLCVNACHLIFGEPSVHT